MNIPAIQSIDLTRLPFGSESPHDTHFLVELIFTSLKLIKNGPFSCEPTVKNYFHEFCNSFAMVNADSTQKYGQSHFWWNHEFFWWSSDKWIYIAWLIDRGHHGPHTYEFLELAISIFFGQNSQKSSNCHTQKGCLSDHKGVVKNKFLHFWKHSQNQLEKCQRLFLQFWERWTGLVKVVNNSDCSAKHLVYQVAKRLPEELQSCCTTVVAKGNHCCKKIRVHLRVK